MEYKYGEFSEMQISEIKKYIQKRIFFLLLIVEQHDNYAYIDINSAFDSEMRKIAGLNKLLFEPPELVRVQALLEAALIEYNSPTYEWVRYRKLVLDAGNEIMKIKEVDNAVLN